MMNPKLVKGARLVWIESFLAAAAYGSYSAAAEHISRSDKAIAAHISDLENWLYKVLVTLEPEIHLTEDGEGFLEIALNVRSLIKRSGLDAEIGRTRVLPNGRLQIEGADLITEDANEIGRLFVSARADVKSSVPYVKINGADIVI